MCLCVFCVLCGWNNYYPTLGWSPSDISTETEMFLGYTRSMPNFFAGKVVVDAGCGNSRYINIVNRISDPAPRLIIGIELSDNVHLAARNCSEYGNVVMLKMDLNLLPRVLKEPVDYIYSIGVLHHTPDARKSFVNLSQCVKKGGFLSAFLYGKGNPILYRVNVYLRNRVFRKWPHRLVYPHVVDRGLRAADDGDAQSHIQPRQVMAKRSMFVGMDVHKESIDVSIAEEGRSGEVGHYGVIPGDLEAVAKVVRALRAPTRRLRFVYEAGPCGFGLHRYLTAQGEDCVVVNPSSMPKRSGDRIKTDRRDGDALARLHRAGELTAIYIPTPEDEALRDLVRAREDAVGLSTQAKHRLKAFLLRQGRRYPGGARWTRPYRRWLADLSFPLAPQHIAWQEYRDTIDETERRVERLTDQLRQLTPAWRWAPVEWRRYRPCAGSHCHGRRPRRRSRRHSTVHASTRAHGVPRPGPFGVPERPSVRRGGITKAGNPHARRLLAEAAWAYQGVPRIGRQMLYRQENVTDAPHEDHRDRRPREQYRRRDRRPHRSRAPTSSA